MVSRWGYGSRRLLASAIVLPAWLAVGSFCAASCHKGGSEPTGATSRGPGGRGGPGPARVAAAGAASGKAVRAPWGDSGEMHPGRVVETYGRMAHVIFDDGHDDWVPAAKVDPPVPPGSEPGRDRCGVAPGDQAMVAWGEHGTRYPGKVLETYGKLARFAWESGEPGWVLCSAAQKP